MTLFNAAFLFAGSVYSLSVIDLGGLKSQFIEKQWETKPVAYSFSWMWSFKCFSKSPRKVALEAKVQNISELNSGHSKKEPNQTETLFLY